jgi:hypothetical protein
MQDELRRVDGWRLLDGFAWVVVVAGWVRVLAAIAGAVADVSHPPDPNEFGALHTANRLVLLGNAGEIGVVLVALLAGGLTWVVAAHGRRSGGRLAAVQLLLGVVALGSLAAGAGQGLFATYSTTVWSQLLLSSLASIGDAVLAIAGLVVLTRLSAVGPAAVVGARDGDDCVFAVDRSSGEVHAFFSYAEAARGIGVYSVEDNEFDFYTDDGRVVSASVVDDYVQFQPTEVTRIEALEQAVREFATRRGIRVDADPDDTAAYAAAIRRWQWLQLWPGWLRWMGWLLRR